MVIEQSRRGYDVQECHRLIGEEESEGTEGEWHPQAGVDRSGQFPPELIRITVIEHRQRDVRTVRTSLYGAERADPPSFELVPQRADRGFRRLIERQLNSERHEIQNRLRGPSRQPPSERLCR